MDNGKTAGDLLRFVGFMTVCVGLAWAVQVMGFGGSGPDGGRFLWILAAATVCGAGVGLIVTSASMVEDEVAAGI